MLEEDISILVGTAHHGTLGVQSSLTELVDSIHVNHFFQIIVVPDLDLLDLVGSTESVEEVQERNTAFDGCQMGNGTKVHNFLGVGLAQHGETGLTAGIYVGMITEDIQCLSSNGTCGYMEDSGKEFASDLVHVGDHQQKSLRSGVGGGQRAGCQRAVHGTGSTGFRLHLGYLNSGAENVLKALSRPLIDVVSHGAGRGNRVNARYFGKRVANMSRSVVAVHGLHFSCHSFSPFRFIWAGQDGSKHIPQPDYKPQVIIPQLCSCVKPNRDDKSVFLDLRDGDQYSLISTLTM